MGEVRVFLYQGFFIYIFDFGFVDSIIVSVSCVVKFC